MSQHTPDAWIERNELDGPEPECPACEQPADHCGCAECVICGWKPYSCECPQCDACGRTMPAPSDDGICVVCAIEWAARRQLMPPPSYARIVDVLIDQIVPVNYDAWIKRIEADDTRTDEQKMEDADAKHVAMLCDGAESEEERIAILDFHAG